MFATTAVDLFEDAEFSPLMEDVEAEIKKEMTISQKKPSERVGEI